MRILWVATKLPWPPNDGGRLLMLRSFQALAEAGFRPTVVAPDGGDRAAGREAERELAPWARLEAVPAAPRPRWRMLFSGLPGTRPWTLARHASPAVARRVAERLAAETYDVVQAEQLQALGSLPEALLSGGASGPPVVWRAQNVESDLWWATARHRGFPLGTWLANQARRLERWEGRAVRDARTVLTLTEPDARRLDRLARAEGAQDPRIVHLPTPFPDELPAAEEPLPGKPAVVVLAGAGWWPNQQGAEWFLSRVVPLLIERLPDVRIHCFGALPEPVDLAAGPGTSGTVVVHAPPRTSRRVFARGALVAVPLFVASGVRMKILESWARGLPVVATSAAARGLEARDGRELLVADTAESFAAAVVRLAEDRDLAGSLVRGGRDLLSRRHPLDRFARSLLDLYRQL